VRQSRVIQHGGVGQQPLQPRVLILQHLQPLGLRDLHPTELRFPFVETGVADSILAARIGERNVGLVLLQNPMICSSEKRLRFMLWSSSWARANFNLDYVQGATSEAEVSHDGK